MHITYAYPQNKLYQAHTRTNTHTHMHQQTHKHDTDSVSHASHKGHHESWIMCTVHNELKGHRITWSQHIWVTFPKWLLQLPSDDTLALALTDLEYPLKTSHVSLPQSKRQTKCWRNDVVDKETGIKSKPKLEEEEEHDEIEPVPESRFANGDFANGNQMSYRTNEIWNGIMCSF